MTIEQSALKRWQESTTRPVAFLHGYDGSPDNYDLRTLTAALTTSSVVRLIGPFRTQDDRFSWWNSDAGTDGGHGDHADHGNGPTADETSMIIQTIASQLPTPSPDETPVVLIGFSQGAAAALTYALLSTQMNLRLAAVVCVAGFLPFDIENTVPPAGVPVLFVHPADDETVDPFLGERASRLLSKAGHQTSFQEVEGGHEWSDRVVGPIATFLTGGS